MTLRSKNPDSRPRVTTVHEIDGLTLVCVNDIVARHTPVLNEADQIAPATALAVAIQRQWPGRAPAYQMTIYRRWTELYKNLPLEDAINAVRAGYSSPSAAMRARVIPKRKYIGFRED